MEQRLLAGVVIYVLEEILLITFSMAHLSENLAVAADDTLDGVVRSVRIVWRLHCRLLIQRIHILERDLAVSEQFLGKLLVHNELALTVADSDSVEITYGEVLEPWRVGCTDAGSDHLRDMTVDVVAEECRAVLCHLTETAVWKESRLHESLESVTDTKDETTTVNESMDCICYILVIKHIGNELSASVRLVSGRESSAEHKDMTLVDILLHFRNRPEDVIFGKVAEHAHPHLSTGIAPSLGRIVVAVRSREDREISYRSLYRFSLVFEFRLLCLVWLHALKTGRNQLLVISFRRVRINFCKLGTMSSNMSNLVPLIVSSLSSPSVTSPMSTASG